MQKWVSRAAGLAVAVAMACAAMAPARAQLFETRAKQAYLMDGETGTVLFSKNADRLVPPASLAKLMTVDVVFHALKSGRLKMDDTFQVSENAWRQGGASSGGSTMFAKVHSTIPLKDLIQGIIVQSANDACIVVAEGMAGSEANFARVMTNRARKIGLKKSTFDNATGLPDPKTRVTMHELALLARHIHDTYPEYYHIFGEESFTWNDIRQRNRNPLVHENIGVDGLKTGHTENAGYGIVASMQRNDRRLYLAMTGMDSERERAEESRKLLEWGMRSFEKHSLFAKNDVVGKVSVYGGTQSSLPVTANKPVSIFLPITDPDRLRAQIDYDWPLKAPVEKGAKVGTLKIFLGDTLSQQTPVYAAAAMDKGPLYKRAFDAFEELTLSQF
ncbi:D-alanyl-D-alanine carboxypeptidase [Pararhizobium mangrovi]|uniref:serine-type D-Ala-D-Ala carboxypeptidase n=2 Tax=Pararhizobium mangrovi TaxID=2590452 RepID=A0A506UDX6_9HYPH|nr:D-alanyl-D-alanine carboxypeptidase family protein [Pararhizobium mangrovi]TPW31331.1 D-alanyl-D-alanine carboxypeptidase [Pararhizobium mangrovi]